MTRVAVSGAAGRMGRLVAGAVAAAPDLDLVAAYDPAGEGQVAGGSRVGADPSALAAAEVVVEFTNPVGGHGEPGPLAGDGPARRGGHLGLRRRPPGRAAGGLGERPAAGAWWCPTSPSGRC